MQLRKAYLVVNGESFPLFAHKYNSFDAFYVDFQLDAAGIGTRYHLFLHPKQDLVLEGTVMEFEVDWPENAPFFANGFQSWSESVWLEAKSEIPGLHPWAKPYMGHYGDACIPGIRRTTPHSWTYCVSEVGGGKQVLLGSLNEKTGFTLFEYQRANRLLIVRKVLNKLPLAHSFPLLDLWVGQGIPAALYDSWFALQDVPLRKQEKITGWTSWYRFGTNINAALLKKEVAGFAKAVSGTPAFFQIDDGWQPAVGDWLGAKADFGENMGAMARHIRDAGLRPGLWLAPFVAAAHAEIVRKNPDWLLKTADGKLLRAGYNPGWKPGRWFYALDFYHPGVQDYLSGVFHLALDNWGYEMLKLDFLFAACLAPPRGKTGGQVMSEAMAFLRSLTGDRILLACGVPLGAAFGLADFCRIGGDTHTAWDNRFMRRIGHREMVSTLAALRNTLGRWPLNGRAFYNDPDVFILRKDKQNLGPEQQYTLLIVNVLLGNALFTSDDVSAYSPEQESEFREALALTRAQVRAVRRLQEDVFEIEYLDQNVAHLAMVNLNDSSVEIQNSRGHLMVLEAFETILLQN